MYAAVCVIGAFSVMGKTLVVLTVGQMSCFLTYANQYTKPFNEISGVITELQTAIVSAKRLFEIVDAQPETEDDENSVSITNCKGNIEIKNVDFSYLPTKPLIKNFNLDVKSGQKIAIVGPTGCGKTTLINLLMRFYDVTGGEISVDGVPITKIKRSDLRSLYGMVLQETWLQEATVRENIAYANKNATDEQVVAAAKAAFAHGFIMRLAKGYDTVICADGGSLSAGEKQLLCIARIMLAKPEMLILDEATSSIDTRTEILINKAFNKLMENRTTFVVAHRLSTIQTADVILVMNNGNIVEKGTHMQLLSQNGFYAKLYNSQFVSK
ncbi:MAG: ABC transporter ATP-binding protein [Oscillospiraceae bacterium]